jgi:site-specific DNA-cytosine methylase
MKVLDLFSGLGGWSKAFLDRGHYVVTVDNNCEFNPTFCKDIIEYEPDEFFDIVLSSPPCTEFTKASMPDSWNKNRTVNPDTKLVERTIEIIKISGCKYWILENVSGSRKFIEPILGKYKKKVGSRYLWGEFPIFDCKPLFGKWKLPPNNNRPALRSLIPYELSLAVCKAIENIN